MPFFSVIIPSYNRAHLIAATIRSVLSQSFNDWELILIDDGSSDNTKDVLGSFVDDRVKYFYQENAERSAARNNGILKATGKFICFLDSDDVWLPHHLQTMYTAIEKNSFKPALYFTVVRWCFDGGRKQDVFFDSPENKNPIEYIIRNQIGPSTQCLHREILMKHQFNTALRVNEDVELNTRIMNEYPLVQIREVTVEMLIHEENTKALFKEYITPQVKAMQIIFSNPALKGKISAAFKKQIQHAFDSQYIMVWEKLGDKSKMNGAILTYLWRYPLDPKNNARVVSLLYNLPGGKFMSSATRFIKSLLGKK